MQLIPRFHGNGFIQVYLNPVTRLHIWHPDAPALPSRVENARVHDHRFDFVSRVLLGTLMQIEYEVTNDANGEHHIYQQGPGHSDKSSPLEFVEPCGLRPIRMTELNPGDVYSMSGPGHFHDSVPKYNETVVTVMTKTHVYEGYRARMIALGGETPDHAFSGSPDLEVLRRIVKSTFDKLF